MKNVKQYINKKGDHEKTEFNIHKLPKKARAPFKGDYRPELDVSEELSPEQAAYYQSLIGILR